MANRFYGVNRGQTQEDIVNASSTQSTDIEVRVDLSKSLTAEEVITKLKQIEDKILANDKWPPA